MGVEARGGAGWGRKRAGDPRAGCYRAGRAACASKRRKTARPRGVRGDLGHVADAVGEGDGCGPASEQGREPLRRLAARVVVVEGEEDAGAAPKGGGDALNALGAQGSAGGEAPSGEGEPVEEPLGNDRQRRRGAEPAEPKHRLGTGQSLESGRPVLIDCAPGEPADDPAGDVGDDDHAGEPLGASLHEQPGVTEPLFGEACRPEGLPQPVSRRVAKAQSYCRIGSYSPCGEVLPRFCVTPEPTGVEARRRGQQGGVAGRQRDGPRTPRSGWAIGGHGRKPGAAVQPRDGLRQGQFLYPLDEVQHIAAEPAAEAVPPFRVGVHREASLRLLVKGAEALADPAPSPEFDARRLHRVAQGAARLQRGDVHVGCDHHARPFASGFNPRKLRRETTLPGRQLIPRTAATSSAPSPVGTRAAALPVPWL